MVSSCGGSNPPAPAINLVLAARTANNGMTIFTFDHSYSRLPDLLFARCNPTPVRNPQIVLYNERLADELGLPPSFTQDADLAELLGGNLMPAGAEPIAQAYAGHQFGHFNRLGDGRALLLGEHRTPSGQHVDIQFKGSGPTPYSRRGDGRAALGPMLREYLISEAMHGLGIPTTRSLAVVSTGEPVWRETALPGAVLTRVASSHIRVGTFEFAARFGDDTVLRALAYYTLARHYPQIGAGEERFAGLLQAVIAAQARLISQWQLVGFVHGVMNTDNMAVSGETIDYGPCAFMDTYDSATVFSSIDRQGRYAYGNQPAIAQWNLARFAETLLPLLHPQRDEAIAIAQNALQGFTTAFDTHWQQGMRVKLGLTTVEQNDDVLIAQWLDWMHRAKADYTNSFRMLSDQPLPPALNDDEGFEQWHTSWQARLAQQAEPLGIIYDAMRAVNPAVIARNHIVEEALEAATGGDLSGITALLDLLATPYVALSDAHARYAVPPTTEAAAAYQTFCGT